MQEIYDIYLCSFSFVFQKYEEKNFPESPINGQTLVLSVSEKWQDMLEKKMIAVAVSTLVINNC